MNNFEFKKQFPELYAPKQRDFHVVEVPELTYIQVDGHGDPNTSQDYIDAVTSLYAMSYGIRAWCKKELGRVHTVGPLEGLWSAMDPRVFTTRDKNQWDWTMMIVQPQWITADIFAETLAETARKKDLPAQNTLRFASVAEGTSVQILHTGSYDSEAPVLARLHDEYMPAHGLTFNGRHHEVYLSDPRRTEPAKLRTVLRQPVASVSVN